MFLYLVLKPDHQARCFFADCAIAFEKKCSPFLLIRPFLMAAAACSSFSKKGVEIESVAVGRRFRRRNRRNSEDQPRLVVVKVKDGPKIAAFESETCAIHSAEDIPELHNPHVFGPSCLATFRFVRKAGFPDVAKMLISVPIESLGKVPPTEFEKLGVSPSVGATLQKKLQTYTPPRPIPIGPPLPATYDSKASKFRTVDEFLHVAGGFTHVENRFKSMPIHQFQKLSQTDFGTLGVSCVIGLFMQNMIKSARHPKSFSLF